MFRYYEVGKKRRCMLRYCVLRGCEVVNREEGRNRPLAIVSGKAG